MGVIGLLIASVIFFFCAPNVLAVTLTIDEFTQKITTNEFEISVTVSGAKSATNYLKVLLYKETEKTLVKTWNGNEWYNGSDGKSYFPTLISGKSTSAKVKAQFTEEVPHGEYMLSIKRFTASGNAADDSITPQSVLVELPQREKASPSPTAVALEKTRTPAPIQIETPEPIVVTETQEPMVEVLAAKVENVSTPISTVIPVTTPTETTSVLPKYKFLWIGIGCFALGVTFVLFGVSGIIKVFPS